MSAPLSTYGKAAVELAHKGPVNSAVGWSFVYIRAPQAPQALGNVTVCEDSVSLASLPLALRRIISGTNTLSLSDSRKSLVQRGSYHGVKDTDRSHHGGFSEGH